MLFRYLFFLLLTVNSEKFFVRLRSPEVNMESFLKQDELVRLANRAKPFIEKTFAFGDFAAFMGDFSKDMLNHLSKSSLVLDITPDIIIRATDVNAQAVQKGAPRHLARLSQRERLPPQGPFTYTYSTVGDGVHAYVIDSGIDVFNSEFGGRAEFGADFTGEGPGDFNGHGTHVAGLIGSRTYGSAKGITIVDVKALDFRGAGSLLSVISALEFLVKHRQAHGGAGLVNLSLGAARSNVLNLAIRSAHSSGLVVVVAAGNLNVDACLTSPGSAGVAVTVGAIDDITDQLAGFTNWGRCVDVFASGVGVESVGKRAAALGEQGVSVSTLRGTGDRDPHGGSVVNASSLILSGTSMASPIVAGLVAGLLQQGVAPSEVKKRLVAASSVGYIGRRGMLLRPFSPNRIASNLVGLGSPYNGEALDDDLEADLEAELDGDLDNDERA